MDIKDKFPKVSKRMEALKGKKPSKAYYNRKTSTMVYVVDGEEVKMWYPKG